MEATVLFISTYDTKGKESEFIKKCIESHNVRCITLDVGVGEGPIGNPDISLEDLCVGADYTVEQIHNMPRGKAVEIASDLAEQRISYMYKERQFSAIVGIGGAGGTQIVTQAMRSLPFGIPKLMMSTLASGNIRWYLEDSDITMVPSVSDVAGLNCITETVFSRFAALSSAAALWYFTKWDDIERNLCKQKNLRIGMTMYGTTTKGVDATREKLDNKGYETIVFHASGAGGRSMEKFVLQGIIHGVLDMTIAEIGAHLCGGLHDAGPNRLESMIDKEIPFLLVPGAADTVVLPPYDDLPEKYRVGRILNYHNPTMTTMRTNVEENAQIGEFIVSKLKNAKRCVKILFPKGGLSSIDKEGEIFYLPEANEELLTTLKKGLEGSNVEILEDDRHICDQGFAEKAALLFEDMMKKHYGKF